MIAAVDRLSPRRKGQFCGLLAGLVLSSAGILQFQLTVDVGTQLFGRSLFAFVAFAVAWCIRGGGLLGRPADARPAVGVILAMAVASSTFILALNLTTVTNTLLFVATCPIVAAILGTRLLGEPFCRSTVMAVALSFVGIVVMVGTPTGGRMVGDTLALISSVSFGIAIVLCRGWPDVSMVPSLCLAQVIVLVATFPLASAEHVSSEQVVWLALLGAGQLGLGQLLLVSAARLLPAAEGAMIPLLETVFGPFWVWAAGAEQLQISTLLGGAIILAAVVVQVRSQSSYELANP